MTNFERIKAMTLEELARASLSCRMCVYDGCECSGSNCYEGVKAWLESEESENMNYMKQVAEMLGLELGEHFTIEEVGEPDMECYLDHRGLNVIGAADDALRKGLLVDLLIGDNEIIKKPWTPRVGDRMFYVRTDGDVDDTYFLPDDIRSLGLLSLGNYFRTREAAEKHKDEVLEHFREVLEV